jgi:hypothetical protein
MYGSSYMFRHYIAIFRERSYCLLRDAQLRSSRQNIVDGRVVSSDVLRKHIIIYLLIPKGKSTVPSGNNIQDRVPLGTRRIEQHIVF